MRKAFRAGRLLLRVNNDDACAKRPAVPSIADLRKLDFKAAESTANLGASVPAVYRFLARFQRYHQAFPQVAD